MVTVGRELSLPHNPLVFDSGPNFHLNLSYRLNKIDTPPSKKHKFIILQHTCADDVVKDEAFIRIEETGEIFHMTLMKPFVCWL